MAKTEKQLRSIIRSIVRDVVNELEDTNEQSPLEELNATANVDGYQTPFAFSKKSEDEHADDIRDTAEVFDYKKTNKELNNTIKLEEGKSLYHLFRDHTDFSPEQKIGVTIREVNKLLTEIEKLLYVSSRFKNETKVSGDKFWKTTNRYLSRIDEKIYRILNKVKEMKGIGYEE